MYSGTVGGGGVQRGFLSVCLAEAPARHTVRYLPGIRQASARHLPGIYQASAEHCEATVRLSQDRGVQQAYSQHTVTTGLGVAVPLATRYVALRLATVLLSDPCHTPYSRS